MEPNDDGCLIWPGATGGAATHRYGVAVFEPGTKIQLVHRAIYARVVGPVAADEHVHHRCGVTRCCNPLHLEALAIPDHIGQWHRDKTHCPNGHPYDEANTYMRSEGWRGCRRCAREAARRRNGTGPRQVKTHCPQGHPYDDENTYLKPDGGRACRICRRAADSRCRARKRSIRIA